MKDDEFTSTKEATVRQLKELVRWQHDVLKEMLMKQDLWTDNQIAVVDAYDQFKQDKLV